MTQAFSGKCSLDSDEWIFAKNKYASQTIRQMALQYINHDVTIVHLGPGQKKASMLIQEDLHHIHMAFESIFKYDSAGGQKRSLMSPGNKLLNVTLFLSQSLQGMFPFHLYLYIDSIYVPFNFSSHLQTCSSHCSAHRADSWLRIRHI